MEGNTHQKDFVYDSEDTGEFDSIFSSEINKSDFKKSGDWNEFVLKMAKTLGVQCSSTERVEEEKSYMTSRLLPPKEIEGINIPLDGSWPSYTYGQSRPFLAF